MSDELRPCPFCGGEARIIAKPYEPKVCVGCDDDTCLGFSGLGWLYDSEQEAAEAWNRRDGSACEQRRTRRTCRVECYPPGYEDNLHYEVCSECGTILTASRPGDSHAARASYCPSCGARVVDES